MAIIIVIAPTKPQGKKGKGEIDYGLVGILLLAKAFDSVIMKPVRDGSGKVRLVIYKI